MSRSPPKSYITVQPVAVLALQVRVRTPGYVPKKTRWVFLGKPTLKNPVKNPAKNPAQNNQILMSYSTVFIRNLLLGLNMYCKHLRTYWNRPGLYMLELTPSANLHLQHCILRNCCSMPSVLQYMVVSCHYLGLLTFMDRLTHTVNGVTGYLL